MRASQTLLLMLVIVTPHTRLRADEPQAGERAHYYLGAHFVTGYWADKADVFRCPVLGEVTETKIAVYVNEANRNTMLLAAALDHLVQHYPQLSRSFFLVSEEQRDSPMTEEELKAKMSSLQSAGKEHGIAKISLGYLKYDTAPTRWRNSLGFFDSGDVVICLIEPGIVPPTEQPVKKNRLPLRSVKPFYRSVAILDSKEIDEETAASAITKALSTLSK